MTTNDASRRETSGAWTWRQTGIAAALIFYLTLAAALILQSPGVHYDEALLVEGAVQMLTSADEPTFAHDRGSWVSFGGRWWPIMCIPYIGAIKAYLMMPAFALFGTRMAVVRIGSALLGALGLIGVAKLGNEGVPGHTGAAAALALGVHPSYLAMTVFDDSGASLWMGCLGLICILAAHYLRRPGSAAAFLTGLAIGVAIWARLNFVWFLVAVVAAALLTMGRRAALPSRHLAAAFGGAVLGVAPLLLYEVLSRLATLRFILEFSAKESVAALLPGRWHELSDLLVSAGEKRLMWGGPLVPDWQRCAVLVVVGASLCVALWPDRQGRQATAWWARGSGLALLLYTGILVTSKLNIHQHHLVTLLPLVAVVTVLGISRVIRKWPRVGAAAAVLGGGYLVLALSWDIAAVRGLHRTGGIGIWSDSISKVTTYLEANHTSERVKVLDWGLANNIFLLSGGFIRPNEIFWGASPTQTATGEPWSSIVARGGIFLTDGERSRTASFAAATKGFLSALADTKVPFKRVEFAERGGKRFAEVFLVSPLQSASAAEAR